MTDSTPHTPQGVAIELRGCGKSFGTQRVLAPLDLSIHAGETLVLLGPSGCGKTTLLRLIAGLEFPEAKGSVHFDGTDVTALPIERRHVGMVFQSYALFPNMDVHDNVAYGLKIREVPEAERNQRTQEMLAMMQIEPLARRRIDQLSGGQRQRVALARAIAPRPRVLLLDEPLTALDAQLRESLRFEINQLLRALHITTVYVTHDQSEAMALGDRIAVMSNGHLEQVGTPQAIYQEPASAFVEQFIGTLNSVGNQRFRPEDAHLVAPASRGAFDGVVESSFFLGDHARVVVALSDGARVSLRTSARSAPVVGQRVGVQVDHFVGSAPRAASHALNP